MIKAKRNIAIFFCGVLFIIKPVYAGIPVLDLGESPTTFKESSNAIESLKKTKDQLTELKKNLQALGDSIKTLSEFSQALGEMFTEIQDIADTVVYTLNDTFGLDIDLNEKLAAAISQIESLEKTLITDMTIAVEGAKDLVNDAENMIDSELNKNVDDTAEDTEESSKKNTDLGKGNFLDKVNAVSDKISDAKDTLNDALDAIESTGLVNTEEIRDKINALAEQQELMMNAINNGCKNWSTNSKSSKNEKENSENEEENNGCKVDLWSGDMDETLVDLRATMDDLDRMGVDTSKMREAIDQAEDAYKDALDIDKKAKKAEAAWDELKGELDKVTSGEVWDKLKKQYGDDKNFWDVMHDIASNADRVSGNLEAVLNRLEAEGIDTSMVREYIDKGYDVANIADRVAAGQSDWEGLMGDIDKVKSGKLWDKLKKQYGDDKNFWDVLHDIATNVEDVSGNLEKVLGRLEDEGFPIDGAQDILDKGKNASEYADKAEKGYNDANKAIHKGLDFLKGKKKGKSNNQSNESDPVVEEGKNKGKSNNQSNESDPVVEEEEEEISSYEEDIDITINNTREEVTQLTIQLNDVFDEALNNMNRKNALVQSRLTELSNALMSLKEDDIDAKDKSQLEKRLNSLIEHSQKVSDWGANIAESARNKYNTEYRDKILDGINNYQKVVHAYANGKATKDDVTIAGSLLRKSVSEINTAPDKAIMVSYKREVGNVISEAQKLGEDIKRIIEIRQKSS